MAPLSTLPGHSGEAAAPARATKIRASPAGRCCNPIADRMPGQAPVSGESTLKYGSPAAFAVASPHANRTASLIAERIPDSRADIEEVRPETVAVPEPVRAPEKIEGGIHGFRQRSRGEPEPRPGLHLICP